ncbi:hypothetical protein P8605_17245 [Streptomyces sp. T-3]|nr:hypothetical protein [Streptomyces sp. T-3]
MTIRRKLRSYLMSSNLKLAAIAAAREDFTNRIGRQVHSMSKAGPVTEYEWGMIGVGVTGIGTYHRAQPR